MNTKRFILACLAALIPMLGQANPVAQVWAKRYAGGGMIDIAAGIAVDSADNSYVVGSMQTGSSTSSFLVLKYDPAGTLLWSRAFVPGGHTTCHAVGIKLDASGNAYGTGWSNSSSSGDDWTVWKFSPSGALLWAHILNGSSNLEDHPGGIAVTPAGDVYVGGFTNETGRVQSTVAKYSTAGALQWTKNSYGPYNEYAWGQDIALDPSGNVFLAGLAEVSFPPAAYSPMIIMYDSAGTLKWSRTVTGSWAYGSTSSVVATTSNVYLCNSVSQAPGSSVFDFLTASWDHTGSQNYAKQFNGAANLNDSAHGIAVDSKGNVAVVGTSYVASNTPDVATVKYDPAGNQLWFELTHGSYPPPAYSNGVAVLFDVYGYPYILSAEADSSSTIDMFVHKYNPAGGLVWGSVYATTFVDTPYGMAMNKNGDIFVTGVTQLSSTQSEISVVRLAQLPIAIADSYSVTNGQTLTVFAPGVLANDRFVGNGTVVLDQQPSHGYVSLNPDGKFSYSSTPGYTGTDSFTYVINRVLMNFEFGSNFGKVTITVKA